MHLPENAMSPESEPVSPTGTTLRPRAPRSAVAFRHVPVRSLSARHRPRILAHLQALPLADRYMRFGYAASDAQLAHYTDLIDFVHDEAFGIFNRRLDLVAMAHLAILPAANGCGPRSEAEFGVSVLPKARGRGYGARLFDHAVLHARNRGIGTLVIHALSENAAMLHIARNAGASIERDGGDAQACLRIPPDSLRSHLEELVAAQVAEVDYGFKVNAYLVSGWFDAIDEVQNQIACVGNQPGD